MPSGYRTPDVNKTEIELAHVREVGETNRNRDALKFRDRSERRESFWKFVNSSATRCLMFVQLTVAAATLSAVAIMYAYARLLR